MSRPAIALTGLLLTAASVAGAAVVVLLAQISACGFEPNAAALCGRDGSMLMWITALMGPGVLGLAGTGTATRRQDLGELLPFLLVGAAPAALLVVALALTA